MPPADPARLPPAAHLAVSFAHEDRTDRFALAGVTAASAPSALASRPGTVLSADEAAYHRRVPAEKRRREYLLGRYAAKSAVAAWLPSGGPDFAADLAAIVIRPGAFQQPVVELSSPHAVGVTLAHSGASAFAIAHDLGHPVGLDFERHDPAHLAVLRSQVAPAELPPPGPGRETESMRHTLAWSVKEALSKALRCGLTCPFEVLALDGLHAHPGGWCAGGFRNFGQYQFAAWTVGDHAFALVCSKLAQIDPVLPSLLDFTRNVLGAPATTTGGHA